MKNEKALLSQEVEILKEKTASLELTDLTLETRIIALKENRGMPEISNGMLFNIKNSLRLMSHLPMKFLFVDLIAIHVALSSTDAIPRNSIVLFNNVLLDIGNG